VNIIKTSNKINLKFTKSSPILFSCSSGYNFYTHNHSQINIFNKSRNIIRHIKSEELFYYIEFPTDFSNKIDLDFWIQIIRKPPNMHNFIWPSDIVQLPGSTNKSCPFALVFSVKSFSDYQNFHTIINNESNLDWQNIIIKKIIRNLLDTFIDFYRLNYAFHEFNINNISYQKNNLNILFDFSFSIQNLKNLYDKVIVNEKQINPDFADSYYYRVERSNYMDLASDYFSIASILFKLMIGRLPYQGSILDDVVNGNEKDHQNWIKTYHKNPIFIFDETDISNHIGDFSHEEIFYGKWMKLPNNIKKMFSEVFATKNVLRKTEKLIFYSPNEWKVALEPILNTN